MEEHLTELTRNALLQAVGLGPWRSVAARILWHPYLTTRRNRREAARRSSSFQAPDVVHAN